MCNSFWLFARSRKTIDEKHKDRFAYTLMLVLTNSILDTNFIKPSLIA